MRYFPLLLFFLLCIPFVLAEERAPVLYVNFDDGSAVAQTGQKAQVSGVTFTDDAVYSGHAASFLEQGDQIVYDISSLLSSSPFFTISFAIHAERDTEVFSLLALGDNYYRDYGFTITQSEDTIQFDVRQDRRLHETIYTTSDLDLSEVKWNVITFVYDNTSLRAYVNGELEKEKSYDKGFSSAYPLRLGATDPAYSFEGQFDEVALFDYALSENQISQLGTNSTNFLQSFSFAAPKKEQPPKKESVAVKEPVIPVIPPPAPEEPSPVAPLPAQSPSPSPVATSIPPAFVVSSGVSVGTILGIVGVAFLTLIAVLTTLLVHSKKKKKAAALALQKQYEEEETRKKVEDAKRKEEDAKKAQEKKGPVLAGTSSADTRLVQFIAHTLQKGNTPSQVYTTLLQKGWKKEQIDAAFLQSRRPS